MICRHCRRDVWIKARGLCSSCHSHPEIRKRYPMGRGYTDDTKIGVPLICVCPTPQPEPCGQCHHCLRPVVQLWPPAAYAAALMAYPEVCAQTTIDWTLRTPA